MARVVAAFDFDGTLCAGDSLLRFIGLAAGRRRLAKALLFHGPRVALATVARVGSRDAAKAAFVRTAMRGLDAGGVARAGESFAAELHDRLRSAAVERVRWHQARGDQVVLISASLCVYLDPLARLLGLDAVLATSLEVGTDGCLTGRLDGANVRAAEKVRRLQGWLQGAICEIWAYGDSAGDRELLAEADHGFLIRRGRWSELPGQKPDKR